MLVPAPGRARRRHPRAAHRGAVSWRDESGKDEKIICVPHDKIHPQFKDNTELATLPEITLKVIEHFFTRYKDLEPGKWVKVVGWGDRKAAEDAIEAGMKAHVAATTKG